MKSAARPILTALRSKRCYTAPAAAARVEHVVLPKQAPKITRLPNGVVVASLENYSPVSRVGIIYNAGSKTETADNLGITHCLRNSSNLTTSRGSGFGITRSVQQLGGSLSCSTTRDHMLYQLESTRDNLAEAFEKLAAAASASGFKYWELNDNTKYTNLDLGMFDQMPEVQMLEGLHQAAYRNALGNSLYMSRLRVGHHTADMLHDFVSQNYTSGNMAVVGVGVDHDELVGLTQSKLQPLDGPAPPDVKSTYHGGEARTNTLSPVVHAAIVTEGASLGSKDLLPLGVLQCVMGTGPTIKYSDNLTTSKVNQAIAQVTGSPFAASCINMNYGGSGLFGFYVVSSAVDSGKVLKAVATQFGNATKGSITDDDVTRGKTQLKAALHMGMESTSTALEDLAGQILISGQILQPQDMDAAIDKITLADVQAVAKRVINGKPSMAAVGNLAATPYLDQILA